MPVLCLCLCLFPLPVLVRSCVSASLSALRAHVRVLLRLCLCRCLCLFCHETWSRERVLRSILSSGRTRSPTAETHDTISTPYFSFKNFSAMAPAVYTYVYMFIHTHMYAYTVADCYRPIKICIRTHACMCVWKDGCACKYAIGLSLCLLIFYASECRRRQTHTSDATDSLASRGAAATCV